MAQDRLATLYEWQETMSKAGKDVKEKHEKEYKLVIECLKTSQNTKERLLAAQTISRFFKYFPEHENEAFDSIVDLCESPDVNVRKHATMAMIAICRDSKQVVSKAADILIQLYQTNEPSEVNLINMSLTTLLQLDIEKFLKSFFANFDEGSEVVRERALKFLSIKIQSVECSKKVEEQLMDYAKKAMEDVTKNEFVTFIDLLSKLKIAKTNAGQTTIVAAIKTLAELGDNFDPADKDTLDKFLLCTANIIPFLSQYNRASEYVNYICVKILPHLKQLESIGQDLTILRTLAVMSPHIISDDVPTLIDLDICCKSAYDKVFEYLPQVLEPEQTPATETNLATDASKSEEPVSVADSKGDANAPTEAKPETPATPIAAACVKSEQDFQFTHIECLLFTFAQLCRHRPELFSEAMLVNNRKRLSHLALGCKKYTSALDSQLSAVRKQDLQKEENKIIKVALKTTRNISTMILDMFQRPPDFKRTQKLDISHLHPRGRVGRELAAPNNANGNNNNNHTGGNKRFKSS